MRKRYERYKDSGIEWIGEVPEHWGITPIKRFFNVVNGGTPKSEEPLYWENGSIVWVTPDDLSQNDNKFITDSKRKITVEGVKNSSASLVPKTSLIVSTRAPIGYVKIAATELSTNQGCKSLVKTNKSSNEIYYYYFLLYSSKHLNSLGQGTTFTELSNYNLANCFTLNFDCREQDSIANYLDQKTSQIDSLITDKEKLIQRLQEYKQSLITEAVTKGLNPNVKMKDSGIEWIGEVPEHWGEKRLKHLAYIYSSNVDKNVIEGEEEVYLCNYVDVYYNEKINFEMDFMKATATEKEIQKFKLHYDDVVITKDSESWDDIAVPAFVAEEINKLLCGYHLALIRPDKRKSMGKYLFRAFMSNGIRDQFMVSANGITRYGLSVNSIKDSLFPNPPLEEQQAIANYLDKKTTHTDFLINDIQTQIQKLQEYRQSLIYEAVTGKIDVRDYVDAPERSERLAQNAPRAI